MSNYSIVYRLEKKFKNELVHWMFIFTCAFGVIDLCFFISYQISGIIADRTLRYFLLRVLLPFALNLLISIFSDRCNKSISLSLAASNLRLSFSIVSMAGIMACVHNYFEALWCGPAITLVIVSAFVNQGILHKMFLYCFPLETLAFLISIGEHPEELSFRLQSLLVAFMVTIFAYGLIRLVQKYYLKILEATKDLAEEKLQAEHNYHYDYLTGVYSRAHFMESADRMLTKSLKARHIGVAMMDIDDFKKINDTYGHEYGDLVLKNLGDLLQNSIHGYGIAGRYGGEEFTILLLDQPSVVYDQLLEKIRTDFENIHYSFTDQKITLSIGLVEGNNTTSMEDMISAADEALYRAKKEGKNRVDR